MLPRAGDLFIKIINFRCGGDELLLSEISSSET